MGLAKYVRTVDLKSFSSERNHAISDVTMFPQNGTCLVPQYCCGQSRGFDKIGYAGNDVTGFARGQSGSFFSIQLGRTISPVLGDLFRSGKKQFLLNLKGFRLVRDPKITEPYL